MTGFTILRAADRPPQPWKNGGGVTTEVIASPPGADMDSFDWRISMALVEHEGAFSCFHGVDRVLAVLEGALDLDVSGERFTLDASSSPLAFAGDAPAYGRPLDGAVRDLNLMVRRGAWLGRMRRSEAVHLVTSAQTTLLVFETAASLEIAGTRIDLAPLDAVMLAAGCKAQVSAPFLLIEIEAAPAKP